MIKVFTPNDVVGFVYGERFSTADRKNLELSIIKEDELADVFYQSQSVKDVLDTLRLEPSARCVNSVLSYSRMIR